MCRINNVLILFLLISVNTIWAEDRPMRNVVPFHMTFTEPSTQHSAIHTNSLLTERALEQPLTQHYIAHYSSPRGIINLTAILERGSIYLPFIRDEVTKRGLPPELVYLPIIESGFQITARSRSGAMGLWQFMMNSISPYNMKVTDIIDERRDFIKSTRGALQKLEDEYKRLECWELTLAAYNSGMGSVTRTIQRTGVNDYWELSSSNELRQETINFVPRLLAVSYVISQPRRFGLFVWQKKFDWTTIPLRRQISIDVLADETGIDRNLLRRLNAELTYGITPADNYLLKVPEAHLDKINAVLERTDIKLLRYYYHVVRQGDTLWSMSRHYGTAINMIEQHNPGISNRYLRIGETVVIPAFTDVPPPARTAVTQSTSAPARNTGNTSTASRTHVVQRGETFWSLGRRYGITPQALAEANGMQINDILHAGRTLRVPIN